MASDAKRTFSNGLDHSKEKIDWQIQQQTSNQKLKTKGRGKAMRAIQQNKVKK